MHAASRSLRRAHGIIAKTRFCPLVSGVEYLERKACSLSNTKQILAMLRSRAEGDEEAFLSIALQIAAAEARQGHRQIAEELRAEVDKARAKTSRGASVAIPFSSPRGSLEGLLELRQ